MTFCRETFKERQRKGSRKNLEHTEGPPCTAGRHVFTHLPTLPHFLHPERCGVESRPHPSSGTMAPDQCVHPCDLQQPVLLQSRQTNDQLSQAEGDSFARDGG